MESVAHSAFLEAFRREMAFQRALSHPSICPVLGSTLWSRYAAGPQVSLVTPWMNNGDIVAFVSQNQVADSDILEYVRSNMHFLVLLSPVR